MYLCEYVSIISVYSCEYILKPIGMYLILIKVVEKECNCVIPENITIYFLWNKVNFPELKDESIY